MKSRDRVKFTVRPSALCKGKMMDVLCDVFGLSVTDIERHKHWDVGLTIICRPSQFARFIILRNEAGLPNGIRELEPKLFVPEDENRGKPVDVSGNPNRVQP